MSVVVKAAAFISVSNTRGKTLWAPRVAIGLETLSARIAARVVSELRGNNGQPSLRCNLSRQTLQVWTAGEGCVDGDDGSCDHVKEEVCVSDARTVGDSELLHDDLRPEKRMSEDDDPASTAYFK